MNIYQWRSIFKIINLKKNNIEILQKFKYAIPCCINQNIGTLTTSSENADIFNEKLKEQNIPKKKYKYDFPHDGPDLRDFIDKWSSKSKNVALEKLTPMDYKYQSHPYINLQDLDGKGRKVFFEVYGCQMNVNDADVAWGILKQHNYELVNSLDEADVILIVTCSIRENAENKIWGKLHTLSKIKMHTNMIKIGVLGCMAERLKYEILNKQKYVDIIAGPDSYRDLPRLLAISYEGDKAINVMLSHDETYADVTPVMVSPSKTSAFVSIMRGCDNMCTYCIVPFTRGKERSRDVNSIITEIKQLYDNGIREVTLLGQNVNSYNDHSITMNYSQPVKNAKGFSTIYKPKNAGLRFADLLDKVSSISDELRIRFTSPHPKDFPDEVLTIMSERHNICKHIHLPAQSGNSRILELMRRGYTRESYIELVFHIMSRLPTVRITSDFICGFCSETEEEFQDTLSLVQQVPYIFLYAFQYSLREKTIAHRKYVDDVPYDVKVDRLQRLMNLFNEKALHNNLNEIGQRHLILVNGYSKRSNESLEGRNEHNLKVFIPYEKLNVDGTDENRLPQPSDYVEVDITEANSRTLKATPLCITKSADFYRRQCI